MSRPSRTPSLSALSTTDNTTPNTYRPDTPLTARPPAELAQEFGRNTDAIGARPTPVGIDEPA
ncbi:hypothetical protein [Nocardiopsis listeri]|uniref:hypothetical protein n=1 Tax=Nocardiopsis listeri TaxID=53440 RepID=UPI0008326B05|nr:hypothetical protein [Nocardiopsis listeri]